MTTICKQSEGIAGVQAATRSPDAPGASLGGAELPLAAAAQAWPYLTYGSLVMVGP